MRVPARKFSSYKCVGRAALEAAERKNSEEEKGKEKEKEENGVTEEIIERVD